MNASNMTTEKDPVYAGVFGCIMVIGLPLNIASLWILLRRHSLRSPNAVLMVNLAVSDLMLVISLPMRVYFYTTGIWPLSTMACLFITMLFRNNLRSSAIFITFISVDRLLAVVYPLRSRHLRTSSNAWKGAAFVWIFVLALNVPESLDFLKTANHTKCFHQNRTTNPRVGIVYFALIVILLVVNIVCTILVSWALRRHLSDFAKVNNKVNVMLIFIMNLVLFTVCFLPLSVAVAIVQTPAIRPLVCLTAVNCCLDPLLYYFSFDGFWKKKEDVAPSREL